MEIHEKSFLIKHPSVVKNLILSCILIVSMTLTSSSNHNHNHDFIFYIAIIWDVICLIFFVFLLKRLFSVKNIKFGDNFIISINELKYNVNQIQFVIIDGDRIGIKIIGKKLVPLDLYFTFKMGTTINGIEELTKWTKRNNISIKYKFFWGWV